ncbi:MAG: hypothetical protein ACRYGK_15170 [Janthinobacterium lividum]
MPGIGPHSMEALRSIWDNPTTELEAPNAPTLTHQTHGWTHANAVPVPTPESAAQNAAYRSNAGRSGFERSLAQNVIQSASASAVTSSTASGTGPLPTGVGRSVFSARPENKQYGEKVVYRAESGSGKNKLRESFTVTASVSEQQARQRAIAAKQQMDAGTWVPKSQR